MDRFAGAARRAAVIAVALGSLGACAVLTWYAVSPGVIGRLGTGHLMVLLGLFLLPPLTFMAWRWEREHCAEVCRGERPELPPCETEQRHTHAARRDDASARQHRRRNEASRV